MAVCTDEEIPREDIVVRDLSEKGVRKSESEIRICKTMLEELAGNEWICEVA